VAKSHHQYNSYVEKMVMTGMIINGKEVTTSMNVAGKVVGVECQLLEYLSAMYRDCQNSC